MDDRIISLREVELHLNERDRLRAFRRAAHMLPQDWYSSPEVIWSITLCARHQGKPFESRELADGVVEAIRFYRDQRLWYVYAFCLMPDHLYLVVRLRPNFTGAPSPLPHLVSLLGRLKRYTTTQIAWKHGLTGALWQREFYDHARRNPDDAENQCRYVLANPIRKGLVSDWRDHPYSGVLNA